MLDFNDNPPCILSDNFGSNHNNNTTQYVLFFLLSANFRCFQSNLNVNGTLSNMHYNLVQIPPNDLILERNDFFLSLSSFSSFRNENKHRFPVGFAYWFEFVILIKSCLSSSIRRINISYCSAQQMCADLNRFLGRSRLICFALVMYFCVYAIFQLNVMANGLRNASRLFLFLWFAKNQTKYQSCNESREREREWNRRFILRIRKQEHKICSTCYWWAMPFGITVFCQFDQFVLLRPTVIHFHIILLTLITLKSLIHQSHTMN